MSARPHAARKRFGQHFLESAWVAKLVDALDARPDETFLEIGPGRGALTVPLAARVKRLLAVEIDRDLAADLPVKVPGIHLVQADFLDVNLPDLLRDSPKPVRVVGNLPYNVASPILFKLVEFFAAGLSLIDATVMLQREVADRLTASPGTKEYGVLGILIGHVASAERILALPPGAFRPAPTVRSAVVALRFHAPDPPARRPDIFHAMVQAIFTRRRKTLANALKAFQPCEIVPPAKVLTEAGLDGGRRPETLTITELVRLANAFPGPGVAGARRPERPA